MFVVAQYVLLFELFRDYLKLGYRRSEVPVFERYPLERASVSATLLFRARYVRLAKDRTGFDWIWR